MTCIIAIKDSNCVVMGGDRYLGNSHVYGIVGSPKFFTKENLIIGLSGNPRDKNLLQYNLEIPERTKNTVEEYVIAQLVPAMRAMYNEHGRMQEESGLESIESSILLGIEGELFSIYGDFQVSQYSEEYAVIGSGQEFALGSLHSTRGMEAEERIRMALEATAAYCSTVSGPFDIGVL